MGALMEFYLFLFLALLSVLVVEGHASVLSEPSSGPFFSNTPMSNFCGFPSGLLQLILTGTEGDLPSETYWNSLLPNTPMPQAIKNSLCTDMLEDESNVVETDKGATQSPYEYTYTATEDQLQPDPFGYGYDDWDDQHANPDVAIFFLEKDMRPGKTMTLHFSTTRNVAFLPHQLANSLPFSSDKLPEILDKLSIKPDSAEAKMVKNTIKECEKHGLKGEEKYCATSLESMVNFSTSKLGSKDIWAVSTEAERESKMKYRTEAGPEKMGGDSSVVCHKKPYPYAVFYCHKMKATTAYMVPMVGSDGTKAKAVAVCHRDTMEWNHKHLAFQLLKVEPGTVPICHFLPENHIIWVPN